jgi:hypothetical protein
MEDTTQGAQRLCASELAWQEQRAVLGWLSCGSGQKVKSDDDI